MTWIHVSILLVWISGVVNAQRTVEADTVRNEPLRQLAGKLGLATPKAEGGWYEVRVWNKQALVFGAAHQVYIVHKTPGKVSVIKYDIQNSQTGFQYATSYKPVQPINEAFWNELVQKDILVLQGMNALRDQMYPKPQPDTLKNIIEADGSVSVRAKRAPKRMAITDGEGYTVEIFSPEGYRCYSYSNPRAYASFYTDIPDLAKFVAILNQLVIAFRPIH